MPLPLLVGGELALELIFPREFTFTPDDPLTPRIPERMKKGPSMPGWVPLADFDRMEGVADIEA